MNAIDLVVRSHHSGATRADCHLKGQEVDLTQSTLIYHAVHGLAFGFTVIADQVLGDRADALRLQAFDPAAPISPLNSGSSEYISKARPDSGLRNKLRFGAITKLIARFAASNPIKLPILERRARSQVAARQIPHGERREISRSSTRPLAIPMGPSASFLDTMPCSRNLRRRPHISA